MQPSNDHTTATTKRCSAILSTLLFLSCPSIPAPRRQCSSQCALQRAIEHTNTPAQPRPPPPPCSQPPCLQERRSPIPQPPSYIHSVPQRELVRTSVKLLNPGPPFSIFFFPSSSGSTVFKAQDKLDGYKTVVIKKVPLSTMTDVIDSTRLPGTGNNTRLFATTGNVGFGNRHDGTSVCKDKEKLQDENVDYFVSWIVDHCCEDDKVGRESRTKDREQNSKQEQQSHESVDDLAGVLLPERDEQEAPDQVAAPRRWSRRRDTSLKISTASGLDQIVKCLGCHRAESELWVSACLLP